MDPRRARAQDWLMGGLGALLVASLFLGWYGVCAAPESAACAQTTAYSAWEAFAVVDVFLLFVGLLALIALVLTLVQRTPAVPLALTSLGVFVALAASILALVRLIVAPDLPGAGSDAGIALLPGAWIGAAATLGVLAAMLASIRDERTPAPGWTLEEQARAVRTLSVSPSGERAPADPTTSPRGAT